MLNRKKIKLLSAFLDGELDQHNKEYVLNKIHTDEEWSKIYNEIKIISDLSSGIKTLLGNPRFVNQVMQRIINDNTKPYGFIPVPKRLVPAAVLLIITAIIIVITYIGQKSSSIENFVVDNMNSVKDIYNSNFTKNDLYPASTTLTNDEVFRFAIDGTLPVNEEKNKAMQFGKNKKNGYFFEVGSMKQKAEINYETDQLYSKLIGKIQQRKRIDSILDHYRKNLEASILVSSQKKLLVDANVWDVNRSLVYDIATNLENESRKIFIAHVNNIRQDGSVEPFSQPSIAYPLKKIKFNHTDPRRFIVLGGNSSSFEDIVINYDSIRSNFERAKEKGDHVNIYIDTIIYSMGSSDHRYYSKKHQQNDVAIVTDHNPKLKIRKTYNTSNGYYASDSSVVRIEIPNMEFYVTMSSGKRGEKLVRSYNEGFKQYSRVRGASDSVVEFTNKILRNFDKNALHILDSIQRIIHFHGNNFNFNSFQNVFDERLLIDSLQKPQINLYKNKGRVWENTGKNNTPNLNLLKDKDYPRNIFRERRNEFDIEIVLDSMIEKTIKLFDRNIKEND